MADRIDIPVALRDEITADLEAGGERAARWRPGVETDHKVLIAGCTCDAPTNHDGHVGPATHDWLPIAASTDDAQGWTSLSVDVPQVAQCEAVAWAPVGGVDGGPRPDIGDRILIRDVRYPDIEGATIGQIATVDEIDNLTGRVAATLTDGQAVSYATRWAILPPCLKTDSEPSHQVADGVPPGAGDDELEVPAEVHALRADLDQALDVGAGLAQIIGPDQPVDPLTANPDHAWPCADYCCTRGCPGIGNTLHGPPWPCDATRCTCGNTVIRAVAHDRQRLARILTDLTAWLTTERDRLDGYDRHADAYSLVLDRLRDQGLDVDYLAEEVQGG